MMVLNRAAGPTPFKVKLEVKSTKRMKFTFHFPDCLYVGPTMEFQHLLYGSHVNSCHRRSGPASENPIQSFVRTVVEGISQLFSSLLVY